MSLYVIGDLHLGSAIDKPMDIFGENWSNHQQKIADNWTGKIKDSDWIVLAGDHSWGTKDTDIIPDLTFINNLPGNKILLKGNHDIWWKTTKKNNEFLEKYKLDRLHMLSYGAMRVENLIVCTFRGWLCPGSENYTEPDQKIYNREVLRLRESIRRAQDLRQGNEEIILFMHFPPCINGEKNEITQIIEENQIKRCYFGHIHGINNKDCDIHSPVTKYKLISADFIGFDPVLVE